MTLLSRVLWLQESLFSSLDCSQFSQALAMCGLAAFTSRRLQHTHQHLLLQQQAPEQLAAFLTLMGLPPLPGQQQQLTAALSNSPAPSKAGTGLQAGGKYKAQSCVNGLGECSLF